MDFDDLWPEVKASPGEVPASLSGENWVVKRYRSAPGIAVSIETVGPVLITRPAAKALGELLIAYSEEP